MKKFVALVVLVLVGASLTIPAMAGHVTPTVVSGNQNCNAATGLKELVRFEGRDLKDGTKNGVTIDVHIVDGEVKTFDWTSTVEIAAVFVKGGPGGNLYDYRPGGETADTGLKAPGKAGVSHITFCVPDPATTTTTTTIEDTTTTTEPEETTTTTEEETTTTLIEEETTTTIEDETTTTVEDSTTTTVEDETTTSVSEETTTSEDDPATTPAARRGSGPEELPFTGPINIGALISFAVALIGGGVAILRKVKLGA